MKKFRSSWLMSALVVGLAGYTYYEYRNASRDLDKALGERFAFSVKRETVDEIRLTSRDESVLLRKEGDEWKVAEPVQDAAESTAVEGFLFQALALKLKEFHSSEDGKLEFAKFGLEPPAATIEIGSKGKKESISVSTKTAFDGSYYVRVNDEILISDPGIREVSERPGSNFRSRRLWREPEGTVIVRVNVERDGGKDKFAFVKDKDKWTMEPAPAFAVDSGKIANWIEKVQDMLPSDFVKEGIEPADRTSYLLAKPSAVIAFNYKGKDGKAEQWVLTLGQDKAEDIFMFTNQRPTIYKTGRATVAKIDVAKAYFRDGHAPFQFEVEKAREVRVSMAKGNFTFKKDDKGWTLSGSKDLELNPEKLVQLFQNIRSLEAQEFVSSGTGLKRNPQIEIRGEGGEILLSLTWGDEYKGKSPWNSSLPFRYVQTQIRQEPMGVAKDKLDKLVDESLVRKIPAEKK